jgi:hypothetical protein
MPASRSISSAEQEGITRGVRRGLTRLYFPAVCSSHSTVARAEASALSSRRMSGLLRSMFTLPTKAHRPLASSSSINTRVAGPWRVAKTAARVVAPRRRSSTNRL